jgi:hypothetical protein
MSQASPGNQARDAARLKAGSAQTPSLRDWAGRLAQADWYLRRGAATGDPAFCQHARQALATQSPPQPPAPSSPEPPGQSPPKPPPPDQSDQSQPDAPAADLVALVQALPAGEVDSGPDFASGEVIDGSADPYQALAMYRLGLVDGVRGPAPLVAHLAAVYGGSLHLPSGRLNLDLDLPPEQIVDAVAPALAADWEPDALYAALRAARPSLGTRRTRRPDDRLSTVDSQDSVGEFRSRLGRDQPLRCAGRVDAPPARGVDVRRATSPTESCQLSIVDCRLAMTRV